MLTDLSMNPYKSSIIISGLSLTSKSELVASYNILLQ